MSAIGLLLAGSGGSAYSLKQEARIRGLRSIYLDSGDYFSDHVSMTSKRDKRRGSRESLEERIRQ